MKNYGLSNKDLKFVQSKIDFQRQYLEDSTFITGNGQIKSLLDVSHSANHSVRYYAQLVNKINTMTDYTKTLGLVPVFVTATLDGFYRDILHHGDIKRFFNHLLKYNSLKDIARRTPKENKLYFRAKDVFKKIPDNAEMNYVRTRIINGDEITVKDLYNILNYQMKLFLASAPFKKMRKEGIKYSYIRTVEPHEDGIPHFHMMFYIAPEYVNEVKLQFTKSFTAPRNSAPLKGCDKGQLECFQWDINKPSAYVLKYVTKSFMDLKNQETIDYMQAWFVYHRIPRCVTSHTVIPQWVFQKIQPLESDWYYLTDIANAPDAQCEWSKDDDYFRFHDSYSNRTLLYDRGLYKIFYDDTIVKQFGERREKKEVYDHFDKVPSKWVMPKKEKYIPLIIDDKNLLFKDGKVFEPSNKSPKHMKDIELYNYFKSIDKDIENANMQHYTYVKNELIDRGMIEGNKQSLDIPKYNDEF